MSFAIAGFHPGLPFGFSNVVHHVANGLARGRQVTVLGFYDETVGEPAGRINAQYELRSLRFGDLARHSNFVAPQSILISIGTTADHLRLRRTFAGRCRELWAYTNLDYPPGGPDLRALVRAVDRVIPSTSNAEQHLREGGARVEVAIPHGVDLSVFRPRGARSETRRRLFAEPETWLFGVFGRNVWRKRHDHALELFHRFTTGAWARCLDCGRITAFELGIVDTVPNPARSCVRCRSQKLVKGHGTPAQLYVHSEPFDDKVPRWSRGFDLRSRAELLGVEPRVRLSHELTPYRLGEGLSEFELAARMEACDFVLAPFDGGGFELTILEAAATGAIPVFTDAAGPSTYARRLGVAIPVESHTTSPLGFRSHFDVNAGLEAILALTQQPNQLQALRDKASSAVSELSWHAVGQRWRALAERVEREVS